MKVLSVNISPPKAVTHRGKTVTTGIFKEPVQGRVALRPAPIDGDGQAYAKHGGPHRVAYVYTFEHYAYWQRELGRADFVYAQFGENLTVEGMTEDAVHIGDVFRVGDAFVQVTQPRLPCDKLDIRMGTAGFFRRFLRSGRVGFFLRVLKAGEVGAGDAITRVEVDPERMTVRQVSRLVSFERDDLAGVERALRIAALSPGWRRAFAERLIKAGRATEAHRAIAAAGEAYGL